MPQSLCDSAKAENTMQLDSCRLFVIVVSFAVLSTCLYAADLQSGRTAYEQKDYVGALKQLAPLAKAGNVDAQLLLGKMYMLGQGVPKNTDLALQWFHAASDQGNAEAEFFLGAMYLLPGKDIPQGLKWLKLSAGQGTTDAQVLLGMAYLKGSDLPRDLVQADMWFHLAAAQGDKFAALQCEGAERKMTSDQIEKAHAMAAAWKPSFPARATNEIPDANPSIRR